MSDEVAACEGDFFPGEGADEGAKVLPVYFALPVFALDGPGLFLKNGDKVDPRILDGEAVLSGKFGPGKYLVGLQRPLKVKSGGQLQLLALFLRQSG